MQETEQNGFYDDYTALGEALEQESLRYSRRLDEEEEAV